MMDAIDEMVESRELDVRCWQCGRHEGRSLKWLSLQRHMSCPQCESVIVLDTSEVRREIALQRRQFTALSVQMGKLLETVGKNANGTQPPTRLPGTIFQLDLALAKKYPHTLITRLRPAVAARRFSG